jgi:hypothetical protein
MNKIIFIITLIATNLLFPSLSYSQIPLIAEDEQGSLRVIGSNKINQDCNSGDIIEAVFPISNISMDTIFISQCVPDCVCTHYAYPEKGIPPGEIDTIYLFLMSKNVPPGPFYKRAIVDFNDGSMELIIEGNINVVRNIVKPGQRPIIYKPKQIKVLNTPKKEENLDEKRY